MGGQIYEGLRERERERWTEGGYLYNFLGWRKECWKTCIAYSRGDLTNLQEGKQSLKPSNSLLEGSFPGMTIVAYCFSFLRYFTDIFNWFFYSIDLLVGVDIRGHSFALLDLFFICILCFGFIFWYLCFSLVNT